MQPLPVIDDRATPFTVTNLNEMPKALLMARLKKGEVLALITKAHQRYGVILGLELYNRLQALDERVSAGRHRMDEPAGTATLSLETKPANYETKRPALETKPAVAGTKYPPLPPFSDADADAADDGMPWS